MAVNHALQKRLRRIAADATERVDSALQNIDARIIAMASDVCNGVRDRQFFR